MQSKRLPLSIQRNEADTFEKESTLPNGKQFYLMAPYQRSKRQRMALIASFVLFCIALTIFIICFKNNNMNIIMSILLIILWLLSLLLYLYSFGIFDHSEQWLSYLLIIDIAQTNTVNDEYLHNKIYLFQESTQKNYSLIATLENIQFDDINIIEQKVNSYLIKISGITFNEFGVSNKDAALFVNDVINCLNNTKCAGETEQITQKEEYKQISKKKCTALGCDICSFNLCSYIIIIWFIITSIICAIFENSVYIDYCSSQQYDDIYDTKYNEQPDNNNGCNDDVVQFLNIWINVWILGNILSIAGLFGLYYLKEKLLILVIIYSIIRAIFWQIIINIVGMTSVVIPIMAAIIIHGAETAILVKTYFIMKSSVTVSYLKNRMNEMREMSNLKNNQGKGIEIVLNEKEQSLS